MSRRRASQWFTCLVNPDWTAVGAVAGVLTAVGTLAMAIAVIVTAVIAARTLNSARDDSRARSRPMMVAEFRREPLSHGAVLLVMKNVGASVASDVRVTFVPSAPVSIEDLPDSDLWKWVYRRYASPVSTWSPGWTLSNVVRTGDDRLEHLVIHVSYKGHDGTPYTETFQLRADHILNETTSTPSKSKDPAVLEQQKVSALQALVREIRAN